jgi:class 3 adenylate cyclase
MNTPQLPTDHYPEERRLATVMFADVQGFTTLAERLDFETISDLIKEVWRRLDAIIEDHDGYIDKHIGDAVMALWGAPFAGENDAELSVTAALALQDELGECVKSLTIPGADKLKMRVGINTGPVLTTYIGLRNEYTVMGDTVNVANRLEDIADPGTVVISESTYRLVRGIFRVRRMPALSVRGRTDPISAYLVDAPAAQPGRIRYRSLDSLETHMVGREDELKRLNAIYAEANNSEKPTMVLITGDAGLGKSRLLMEFTNQLELDDPSINIISARALNQASQIPFFLWKSLWHNYFGISGDEPIEVSQGKFLLEVQKIWGKQLGLTSSLEAAHLVGHLTGLKWPESKYISDLEKDPNAGVKRAFEMSAELLSRLCTTRQTVLLLDDLQWADKGSLDLLAYIFQSTSCTLPILILSAARTEFIRERPIWANLAEIITLQPVLFDTKSVARAYPDIRFITEPVLDQLAHRAEGNPYFLEEMVKSLVKSNLSEGNRTQGEMLDQLNTQPPESLQVMLQARLDALSREARSVALWASVVGRVFWVGAVIACANTATDTGTGPLVSVPPMVVERIIQDALRQLVRAELAFPRASSRFSSDQEYIFKHSLLREVAYSMIPLKIRDNYHLAVAHWLADHDNPDFQVMSADHFENAGSYFEAAEQYERAADYARARGAEGDAKSLLGRAKVLRSKLRIETI